jgi:hypothetical protein
MNWCCVQKKRKGKSWLRQRFGEANDLSTALIRDNHVIMMSSSRLSLVSEIYISELDESDYFDPLECVSLNKISGVTLLDGTTIETLEYILNKIMVDGNHICMVTTERTHQNTIIILLFVNSILKSDKSVDRETIEFLRSKGYGECDVESSVVNGFIRHYKVLYVNGRIRFFFDNQ